MRKILCLWWCCCVSSCLLFAQSASKKKEVDLKEVTVKEYQKTPRYLLKVDTIQQQKSAFFILRAKEALDRDLYRDAHAFIKTALELNPNNYEAHRLSADILALLREYEKAMKEYRICNEIAGDSAAVWYNLGQMHLQLANKKEALRSFSRAIELDRAYALAYMARASLNMENGRYRAALPDLDAVLNMHPMFYNGNKTRGVARLRTKDYNGAVEDFNIYLAYDTADGYCTVQRGLAYLGSGNLVKGCLDFNHALRLGYTQARQAIKDHCE